MGLASCRLVKAAKIDKNVLPAAATQCCENQPDCAPYKPRIPSHTNLLLDSLFPIAFDIFILDTTNPTLSFFQTKIYIVIQ